MKNISSVLKKFSNLLDKDSLIKGSISQVIEEKTKIKITSNDFNLKEGILEIKTSPVAKNEIRFKEESIKDELKEVYKVFITRILYK